MDHETDEDGLAGAIARAGRIWAEALAASPPYVARRDSPVQATVYEPGPAARTP